MSYQQRFYPESRFGGFTDIDGTITFYTRVNELVSGEDRLVDFGCGRGAHADDAIDIRRKLRDFRGRVDQVVGLDIDPAAKENPTVDEFRFLEGSTWPVESGSANVVFSDYVLEHLEQPDDFFSEAQRVLTPDGFLCVRTTNMWSYPALLSRLVPNELHDLVVTLAQQNREEKDVFPTHYECNTADTIEEQFDRHGFDGIAYAYHPEPAYLDFSKFMYWLGTLHSKFAPRAIGPALFGFAKAI
jgi:SAM-dependent methyltransferase